MKIYFCDFTEQFSTTNPTDKFLYKKGKKWAHILYDWLDISKGGSSKGDKLLIDDSILENSTQLKPEEIVLYKLQGIL